MRKVARWDRANKRFELYLDDEFIGYCYTTWSDACALLNQAAWAKLQATTEAQDGR